MGDINLLGMIRKLKSSISGFVSTSDKATKSKFGIVKVGDNLSVSSGTISVPVATEETYGVVKAGGSGGFEQIYSEESTPVVSTTPITLSKSSADYKALMIVYKRGDKLFNCWCTTGQNIINCTCGARTYGNNPDGISFTPNGTTLTWSYNQNAEITWYAVYGIK